MSSHSGPRTATSGLVFHYDLSNTQKSFKGKPTVNYLDNPTQEFSRTEFGQYYNLVPIFETYGLVPYSLSFEMRADKPGSVSWYMQNGSYTKYTFVNHVRNATTQWQRFSIDGVTPAGPSATWLANTPGDNRAMLATYTTYGSGVFPMVRNMQLELGAYSTPFVNGTRSSTQSIIDLTGTNTLDATSAGWNGTGQITYNGTSNYLIGSGNLGLTGDPAFTIAYWARWEDGSFSTNYPSGVGNNSTGVANAGLSTTWADGRIALDFWNNRFKATNALTVNTWYYVAFTKTPGVIGSTVTLYVNGASVGGAVEGSNVAPVITNAPIVIGRLDATRWFKGSIPNVQIYNRALSPTEIMTNFRAQKGRFGL